MFHYTSCGLRNVYLANGYNVKRTAYGKAVAIEDVDGLHRCIAMQLVCDKPRLSGAEFRFLRKELGMSQSRLAAVLGNNAQTVAKWEKMGRPPKWGDRFLRALYREVAEGNAEIISLVDRINDLDRDAFNRKLTFESSNEGWRPKAA